MLERADGRLPDVVRAELEQMVGYARSGEDLQWSKPMTEGAAWDVYRFMIGEGWAQVVVKFFSA